MRANVPKQPRPWERLPSSQRKAIEEYYLERLQQQEERDARIMLDLYTKMTVCVLHDGHEMDEDELICFLGNHKRLFQRHARMVREGTQLDYFNKRMAEIFPTSGFPQQFFDDMLGAVEEPVFDEDATAKVDNKQSEWISLKDRLPEKVDFYLVSTIDHFGLDCVTVLPYTELFGFGSFEVTHWMPLPEPPKMKGGAE